MQRIVISELRHDEHLVGPEPPKIGPVIEVPIGKLGERAIAAAPRLLFLHTWASFRRVIARKTKMPKFLLTNQ
jgi:hypothetical protein